MTQLSEAIETCFYGIANLSEHTRISYRHKLRVLEQFCNEREIGLEDIIPQDTAVDVLVSPRAILPAIPLILKEGLRIGVVWSGWLHLLGRLSVVELLY